jgi:hypothetical protein
MTFNKIFSLTFTGLILAQIPVSAIPQSPIESNSNPNLLESELILAQGQNPSSSGSSSGSTPSRNRPSTTQNRNRPTTTPSRNRPTSTPSGNRPTSQDVGTKEQIESRYNCKMERKQINNQTQYACIRHKFQIINYQGNPATALVKEIARVQQNPNNPSQYKISPEWKTSGEPQPVIVWTTRGNEQFADQYTPQVRAEMVTNKFNQYLIRQGQLVNPLVLSHKKIGNQTVVCATPPESCSNNNFLWTLKKHNYFVDIARTMQANIGKGEASALIWESEDDEIPDTISLDTTTLIEETDAGFSTFESDDDWSIDNQNPDVWDDSESGDDWGEFESEDDSTEFENQEDWGEFESEDGWEDNF